MSGLKESEIPLPNFLKELLAIGTNLTGYLSHSLGSRLITLPMPREKVLKPSLTSVFARFIVVW